MSSQRYLIVYRPGASKNSKKPLGPLASVIKDFNDSFKGLLWESKSATSPKQGFSIELGLEKELTDYISQGLPGFKKLPGNKVKSPQGIIELGLDDNSVHRATIAVGRMDLQTLAALCKRRGWRLEDPDAESDSDVDLDDPGGWFVRHYA
jgi:hypothetical protein